MKGRFLKWILGVVAVSLALSLSAWGQLAAVRGTVKDEQGKPIEGATIELKAKEASRSYTFKTDKKGEFNSIGIYPDVYKATLKKGDVELWVSDNYQVRLATVDSINILDFDLTKLKKEAAKSGPVQLTEEQKRQLAEAQKENAKIGNLNQMIASAQAAEDAKQWDQAIATMNQAAAADATKHEIWAKLCEVEVGGGKLAEAEQHCQQAITLAEAQPNVDKTRMAGYHNNLGQAYAKGGKTKEATGEYKRASEIDPAGAAKYYFNLGAVLTNVSAKQQDQTARFRMIDEATEAFDKATTADPTYAEAYYQKAVNLLGKATLDKANKMVAPPGTAEAFNKYLELEPTGPRAEEVKGMLAYIGAEVKTTYGKPRVKK
ncbi:MAG: carboxypeptidase regulatory-like domain-containing protein [Acidobacteriota bacterium]|nr:carboxypeptidase regulatory-like domain-containing protein [Acidobacteriota bacterium]